MLQLLIFRRSVRRLGNAKSAIWKYPWTALMDNSKYARLTPRALRVHPEPQLSHPFQFLVTERVCALPRPLNGAESRWRNILLPSWQRGKWSAVTHISRNEYEHCRDSSHSLSPETSWQPNAILPNPAILVKSNVSVISWNLVVDISLQVQITTMLNSEWVPRLLCECETSHVNPN